MGIIMIFIDGLGLGSDIPDINPLLAADLPSIRNAFQMVPTQTSIGKGIVEPNKVLKAIDTRLGVQGLPQSATGQTALFTGTNAPQLTGRHINGFPTKALRDILERHSIFKQINQTGRRAVFANTFTEEYFESVRRGRWRYSASTTAALAGGCRLLMVEDLNRGYAVYQDLINEQLRDRNYPVPLITPEKAGENLVRLAEAYDFTLFEYFQTDRCGHAQDWDLALILLNRLDRFVATVVSRMPPSFCLVLTSDHGNIEDLSVKTHTLNPVPLLVFGAGAESFGKVNSLADVCPAILDRLGIPVANDIAIG
ncbi:MAG: metalloenzyme [Bacteroidota bacterium]